MGSLIQSTPVSEEPDTSRRTIAIAVAVVIVVAVVAAFLLRGKPKGPTGPPPYASNLKLSDLRLSAEQNFVGATISYVDGIVTNAGNKTVTRVTVEVDFKDDMGQITQREELPLQILKMSGPYPEAVPFSTAPLGPGQNKPFRLTFESISAQWNHSYPDIQITDLSLN
jgi:hypothetical protein